MNSTRTLLAALVVCFASGCAAADAPSAEDAADAPGEAEAPAADPDTEASASTAEALTSRVGVGTARVCWTADCARFTQYSCRVDGSHANHTELRFRGGSAS